VSKYLAQVRGLVSLTAVGGKLHMVHVASKPGDDAYFVVNYWRVFDSPPPPHPHVTSSDVHVLVGSSDLTKCIRVDYQPEEGNSVVGTTEMVNAKLEYRAREAILGAIQLWVAEATR